MRQSVRRFLSEGWMLLWAAVLASGVATLYGMAYSAAATINFVGSPYLVPTGGWVTSYQIQTGAASNATFTMLKGQAFLDMTNSGSITGDTIIFPPQAYDGQQFCMFSVGGIGSGLTMSAALATQSITGGLTALTANTQYCYLYTAASQVWYRVQ